MDNVAIKHIGGTPLTKKAIAYAIEKHAGQTRKTSGLPYIVHPIEVFALIRKYKDSNNVDVLGAAAILHDVMEDCGVEYQELVEEFGYAVADIVAELTNDPDEIARFGKLVYINKKLATISSYALTVKMADMLANINEDPDAKTVNRIRNHCYFLANMTVRALTRTQRALLSELSYALLPPAV